MVTEIIFVSLLISTCLTLIVGFIGVIYIRSLFRTQGKKINIRVNKVCKMHSHTQEKIDDLSKQINNVRANLTNDLVKTIHIKNSATGGSIKK